MSFCVNCDEGMKIEDLQWVCRSCGLKRDIAVPIPSQAELWIECKRLRRLEDIASRFVSGDPNAADELYEFFR